MDLRLGGLSLWLAAGLVLAAPPPGTVQVPADTVPWVAGGANLPPGTQVAILEGDPKRPGPFTMRLRAVAGTRIPPHRHPRPERVTVLSGTVLVGFGERFDERGAARFGAGGFYINPPGAAHFVWFPEDTVVQVTGEGPWVIEPVPGDPKSAAPTP